MTDNSFRPGYLSDRLVAWRMRTDGPLLVLAIGSLPLLLLDLKRGDLGYADQLFLDTVNAIVLIAFATDYIVELSLAADRWQYTLREWTSATIVLAQALALIPALFGFGVLRVLRAGRVWRGIAVLARLIAIGGAGAREGREILRHHAARFALGLAGFTWVSSAVGFTFAEDVGLDSRVHSFGDALWWSAATITTVGYGDIYPVTFVGRIIGVITMVVGISTFAVVTAKMAEFLVRSESRAKISDVENAPRDSGSVHGD